MWEGATIRLLTFIMGQSVLEETLRGQFRVWEEEPVCHARFPSRHEVIWAAPRPGQVRNLIPFARQWESWSSDDPRVLTALLMEAPGFSDPTEFFASLMASGYVLELAIIRPADLSPVPKLESIFQDSIIWIDAGRPAEIGPRLRSLRGISLALRQRA